MNTDLTLTDVNFYSYIYIYIKLYGVNPFKGFFVSKIDILLSWNVFSFVRQLFFQRICFSTLILCLFNSGLAREPFKN